MEENTKHVFEEGEDIEFTGPNREINQKKHGKRPLRAKSVTTEEDGSQTLEVFDVHGNQIGDGEWKSKHFAPKKSIPNNMSVI